MEQRDVRNLKDLDRRIKDADPTGKGISYGYLAQIARGAVTPTATVMLLIASALDVEPDVFTEYRLAVVRDQFDPAELPWDQLDENLQALERALAGQPRTLLAKRLLPILREHRAASRTGASTAPVKGGKRT